MPYRSDLSYRYDGTFEGLLCCVFESYEKKEVPSEILSTRASQGVLFPVKEIITDNKRYQRVLISIRSKMGVRVLDFIRHAFLTCLSHKELYILRFIRMGYHYGPQVMGMLTDEVVDTLFKAVKHLDRESHLFKGFVRFSVFEDVLVSEIEPKNYVLPLLTRHFSQRFPEERFLIFDRTHDMALIYQPYKSAIVPMEALKMPEPDEEEEAFRVLWQLFYDTIEVEGRYNPKCRMSHMPKRYWRFMTEFGNLV